MKKILIILIIPILVFSCKNKENKKNDVNIVETTLNQDDKQYVDLLTSILKETELKVNMDCDQRCQTCRQQARYRLSACLRSASNETQRAQCRSNYMRRIRECNNSFDAENKTNISIEEKIFVDIIYENIDENSLTCNQRCQACKQQARYRLSSCLRSASNETQRAQCRSNYMRRLQGCNN